MSSVCALCQEDGEQESAWAEFLVTETLEDIEIDEEAEDECWISFERMTVLLSAAGADRARDEKHYDTRMHPRRGLQYNFVEDKRSKKRHSAKKS